MNQFEKDITKRILMAMTVKWVIIIGVTRLARRAVKHKSN